MSDETSETSHFESFWQGLLDDTAETATAYREDGWTVQVMKTGDVTALDGTDKPYGLSVLVPDSAFEELQERVEYCSFESVDVFSRTVSTHVFLLVVERDPESETAVLIPMYYNHVTDSGLLKAAEDGGEMRVHVRSLGADDTITFIHDDISIFEPDRDGY